MAKDGVERIQPTDKLHPIVENQYRKAGEEMEGTVRTCWVRYIDTTGDDILDSAVGLAFLAQGEDSKIDDEGWVVPILFTAPRKVWDKPWKKWSDADRARVDVGTMHSRKTVPEMSKGHFVAPEGNDPIGIRPQYLTPSCDLLVPDGPEPPQIGNFSPEMGDELHLSVSSWRLYVKTDEGTKEFPHETGAVIFNFKGGKIRMIEATEGLRPESESQFRKF